MKISSVSSNILQILERDLNKVIQEIHVFQREESLWILEGNINNTAGNLVLHIAGAVNHFIGKVIGKNEYVRKREQEFSEKFIPKEELIENILQAIATIKKYLPLLQDKDMEKDFPEKIGGRKMTIGFFLVHLVSHINYHLGQINYHRRILEK